MSNLTMCEHKPQYEIPSGMDVGPVCALCALEDLRTDFSQVDYLREQAEAANAALLARAEQAEAAEALMWAYCDDNNPLLGHDWEKFGKEGTPAQRAAAVLRAAGPLADTLKRKEIAWLLDDTEKGLTDPEKIIVLDYLEAVDALRAARQGETP